MKAEAPIRINLVLRHTIHLLVSLAVMAVQFVFFLKFIEETIAAG